MNDTFKEFKARLRKLEGILQDRGLSDADFAQALSKVRRAERHGDRSRPPTPELEALLARAEGIGRRLG